MTREWTLTSPHVEAKVQALGAMIGPAVFHLPSGPVQPFAVAPWAEDTGADHDALPGILKRLRGEWPCVPFGMDGDRPDLPADWQPADGASVDDSPHGFGSNNDWHAVEVAADALTLAIDYPEAHPIRRLERVIRLVPGRAAIAFTLTIHARRDCDLPIGFHPVYHLPVTPGDLRLDLASGARAWTFPLPVEPGRTVLIQDQRDQSPSALAMVGGGTADASHLPLPKQGEDLVLLTGLKGEIGLRYPALGYRVAQRWDGEHMPSCLLWMSGQGRQFYPWSGRFRGLGVEPIAAPFDLGPLTGIADNPLAQAGIATSVALRADTPFTTEYEIACEAL